MVAPVSERASPFQAEWPKRLDPSLKSLISKVGKVFWLILSIVIFPIGLIRLAGHYLRKFAFQVLIPNLDQHGALEAEKAQLKMHGGQRVPIKSPDGASLDCAFFPGKNREKVILFIGGNNERWETHDWYNLLKDTNASILFVNSRGVGNSTGPLYADGYALDVYTAAEYLIQEKGIDPEAIAFTGYSMGAANTTRGASLIQEKYPDKKIKAINIYSFSSLGMQIHEVLKNNGFFAFIERGAARIFQIDMDVKKDFDSLNGEKYVFYNPDDPNMPRPAQLATAIQKTSIGKTYLVQCSRHSGHFPFQVPKDRIHFHNVLRKLLQIKPTWSQWRAAKSIEDLEEQAAS